MNRRELLTLAGGVGAVMLAGNKVLAAGAAPTPAKPSEANQALAAAAAACVNSGSACLQHCLSSLGTGDTMMAACSKAVADMLAQTRALVDLANAGSKHLKAAAKVASDIAKDCEAECRKHQAMSAVCKKCGEDCSALIAASAKV